MDVAWTPVALSRDIPAGTAAPGEIDGSGLAIWRGQSGAISVWADRCPHRGMRLSHGFVRGDALSCVYHGWRYDASGRCLRIPAHPEVTPPGAIRVPVFAAAETSGVIWAAPYDAAPETPPPAFPGFDGFRSLRVEVPAASLRKAIGARRTAFGSVEVVALIQPLGSGASGLHLLASETAEFAMLDVLSVAAEALRRRLEDERERLAT